MQRIHRVAVLIETSREYGRGLLQGVIRFRQENPDWSIYFQQQDLGAALPKWLTSWRGDGILARVTDQSAAKQLLATKVPLIDLRGGTRDLGIPLFGIDNQSVAVHAFNHLKACGLQHFAFVGEPIGQHVYDDVRREAFSRLVKEQGDPCHVFKTRSSNRHANWDEHQQRLAQWLKQLPQPVGIMCCHDDRGQQVLDACQRANLGVPDEVAVIGVDNDDFLCKLSIPSLTSVDVRSERIGYQAAKLLHEVMNGEATFDQPVLFNAAGVVVRQSTDVITCGDPEITKGDAIHSPERMQSIIRGRCSAACDPFSIGTESTIQKTHWASPQTRDTTGAIGNSEAIVKQQFSLCTRNRTPMWFQ